MLDPSKKLKLPVSLLPALNIMILILFPFLFANQLFSQQPVDYAKDPDIKNYKEEVFIRTDRDIYISGEDVWVKVYVLNGLTHTPDDLSKVVYLELLDKNNFPLRQVKVKTDKSIGSASFTLPDNISSGNYLIRAYTNWMKNFSTDEFFYRTISVINPFESIDHLKIPADTKSSDSVNIIARALPQANIYDSGGNQIVKQSFTVDNNKVINFKITLNKPDYATRERIRMEIYASDMSGNPVKTSMSVSVAKSGVVNSSGLSSFYRIGSTDSRIHRVDGAENLAELEGHIISGYIRLKATDETLKKTDLSLSFVGKAARCQFSKSDDKGAFNFVIKEPGLNEIVIQPLSPDISGYYIELNQPFSSTFSKFKPAEFYLDSSRLEKINKVIIGMQVNNIYEPFRQTRSDESTIVIPDFYGKPESTIIMADYIELTSLKEVVKELLPNVYTLKQNGKHDFKLINKFRGQPFENKPLILVDGVPVYDFEKVLSINSKDIDRAEIINTRYFISGNVFDGLVSFITKKANLSVMEFDNSIFRQAYEGCQLQNSFYSPDYSTAPTKDKHIPDFRNTLYWKPDLLTGTDGRSEIEFFTSDESSDYEIVVEGISPDGKTGYTSASFSVK